MKKRLRILVVVLGAAIFAVGAPLLPELTAAPVVKSISSIYACVVALLLLFFRQLAAAAPTGLSFKELDRLNMRKVEIRRRIWQVVLVCAASASALWVLATLEPHGLKDRLFGAVIGFLFSLGLSYCLALLRWIDDLAKFQDDVRLRETKRRAHEEERKRLADARKPALKA